MIDYKVVKDPTVWGIQMKVNELVTEGWQPNGALSVDNGEYIQTMIKEVEEVSTSDTIENVVLVEEETSKPHKKSSKKKKAVEEKVEEITDLDKDVIEDVPDEIVIFD